MKEFYDNGYGISVISNSHSYGGENGLYEIAVLIGDIEKSSLCYDTHITNDVIGHLTEYQVDEIISQIKLLPATPNAIMKRRDSIINIILE